MIDSFAAPTINHAKTQKGRGAPYLRSALRQRRNGNLSRPKQECTTPKRECIAMN
ncbi:MAG: hypothetical protein K6G73_04465 [Marinilabiliaceae bacterium]|nr:hypothetical protein [Marinilabiliaceae bacterium]